MRVPHEADREPPPVVWVLWCATCGSVVAADTRKQRFPCPYCPPGHRWPMEIVRYERAAAVAPEGPITPRPARDAIEQEAIAPTRSERDYCPSSWPGDIEMCCTRPVHQRGDHVVGREGLIIARWKP